MKKGVTNIIVKVNIYVEILLTITRITVTIVINVGHQVIWCVDVTHHHQVITGTGRPVVDNIKSRSNNCYNCNKILSDRE